MTTPTVYDAKGRLLEVGLRVVRPGHPDEVGTVSLVGRRSTGRVVVDVDWPDDFSERLAARDALDLLLITDDEKGSNDG